MTVVRCNTHECSATHPPFDEPFLVLKLNKAAYSAIKLLAYRIYETLTPVMAGIARLSSLKRSLTRSHMEPSLTMREHHCTAESGMHIDRLEPSEAFIHLMALLHSKLCERVDVYGNPSGMLPLRV